MKKIVLALIALLPLPLISQTGAINGFCEQGAKKAVTSGLSSTNTLDGILPSCTVTVYLTGTATPATVYSDVINTPLSNPFTASSTGQWLMFGAQGVGLDIQLSSGITITDVVPSGTSALFCSLTGCTFTGPISGTTASFATITSTNDNSTTVNTTTVNATNGNFSGAVAATTVNNVCNAYSQGGADAGAKILSCVTALGGKSGIIDATGFTGSQTISENVLGAIIFSGVTIKFGSATFNWTVPQVPAADSITVEGNFSTVFTVGFTAGDVFNLSGRAYMSFLRFTMQPASGIVRTSGSFFNLGPSGGDLFQDLNLNDPYQGFFINGQSHTFNRIRILTPAGNPLNYGMFVYSGNVSSTVDITMNNIYMVNSLASFSDSLMHIRNRVSTSRWTDIELVGNGGGTSLAFDCDAGGSTSTSEASGTACTNVYAGAPTNRPEILRFEHLILEGGDTTSHSAIVIAGGQDLKFTNSYMGGGIHVFNISGESTAIGIYNSIIYLGQQSCIYDTAIGAGEMGDANGYATLLVSGNTISNCSQVLGGIYPEIEIGSATSGVTIVGNRIGHNTFLNSAYDGVIGVQMDGLNNNVSITANDFTNTFSSGSSTVGRFTYDVLRNGTNGTGFEYFGNTGNPLTENIQEQFASPLAAPSGTFTSLLVTPASSASVVAAQQWLNPNTGNGSGVSLSLGAFNTGWASLISAKGYPSNNNGSDLWIQSRATVGTLNYGVYIDNSGTIHLGNSNRTIDVNGVAHDATSAPTISGTGASLSNGTNAGGIITLASATSATITFANSGYNAWAACTGNVSSGSTPVTVTAQSKTACTLSFASTSGTLNYHVDGN